MKRRKRAKRRSILEIRKQDGELDEVIVRNPDSVHFEQMAGNHIWCGITVGDRLIHVNISHPHHNAKLIYRVEE